MSIYLHTILSILLFVVSASPAYSINYQSTGQPHSLPRCLLDAWCEQLQQNLNVLVRDSRMRIKTQGNANKTQIYHRSVSPACPAWLSCSTGSLVLIGQSDKLTNPVETGINQILSEPCSNAQLGVHDSSVQLMYCTY